MEKNQYQGQFLRVTEEDIEGAVYERAYIQDSVTVFPIDDQGNILLIKEKRVHETPSETWKLVTGFCEEDEDPLENANRELQEEVGYKSDDLEHFFSIQHTGTINMTQHFVLARRLSISKLPNPDGDVILQVEAQPLEQLVQRALSGELARGGSTGYAILKLHLEVNEGKVKLT
jgi:ADP-ribose pyrophosphatase